MKSKLEPPKLDSQTAQQIEINPDNSASKTGSKASSSLSSMRAEAAAEKAALTPKASICLSSIYLSATKASS